MVKAPESHGGYKRSKDNILRFFKKISLEKFLYKSDQVIPKIRLIFEYGKRFLNKNDFTKRF